MQREVDALGRQLTALRTVISAQADRERAGYRQGDAEGGVWMAGVWTAGGSGTAVGSDNAAASSADSGAGNPQQAYQQTPPRPVAAQAGYQQASGKQDLENDRQGDSAGLRCRTDLPESGVFCDAGAAVS